MLLRRTHAIAALGLLLCWEPTVAQMTDPATAKVGDQICFEGFVMDHFCIDRGTLLDAPDVVSLMNPELHSLHCLIDVPVCRESPYELLAPPPTGGGYGDDTMMYTRAFRLTENSKQGFLATASAVGNPTPPGKALCTDCVGTEGSLNSGFRAEVYGVVVEPADGSTPPVVHVVDARASNDISNPCEQPFPTEQNEVFGKPMMGVVEDIASLAVGDEICYEGFVMDHFCIERGTLLDAPTVVSLLNPELHSLHCLIDVPRCRESPYELLAPPGDGETMYSRAFRLTENSKEGILNVAAAVGNPSPPDKAPCTMCVGTEGSLNSGFRAEVYGVVSALAKDDGTPAEIHVVDAFASSGTTNPCAKPFPVAQNADFGVPFGVGVADVEMVAVGDEICYEGFVMDHFCIERGTLLDAPTVVSLLNPELHSLHCLIDVPRCRESPYELLAPPGDGEEMYSRAFRLTENSKEGILGVAAAVGNPSPPDEAPCTMCVGTEGSLNSGFRAEVYGVVTALAKEDGTPAEIHVVDAVASSDDRNPCSKLFPQQQNPVFGEPLVGMADVETVSAGDEICFEGFVMDHFCIDRGTFLDAPDVVSLESPELHSLHCLIDVPGCRESPFELLAPPDEGETTYTRAFRLTENSKEGILSVAAANGNPTPPDKAPCTSCVGTDGMLNSGFRAEVYGIVTAPAAADGTPALVHVVDAFASQSLTDPCMKPFPSEQNPVFGSPFTRGIGVTDPSTVAVGDEICVEGFVMDNYCIERGTLFDNPTVETLVNPAVHSVHCLIDVPSCRESNYEILREPEDGETLFTRAFQLDDPGKVGIQNLAAAVSSTKDCTECTGERGDLRAGFRAEVYGVVVELTDPPTIRIVDALHSNGDDNPCSLEQFPEQNEAFLGTSEEEKTASRGGGEMFTIVVAIIAILAILFIGVYDLQKNSASKADTSLGAKEEQAGLNGPQPSNEEC